MMNLFALADHFNEIDATPPGYPGRFVFTLPNRRAYERWPDYPQAARPASGRAAAGKGLDALSCRISGLGEAIELASCCQWGDEDLMTATSGELAGHAITPAEALGFSAAQYAGRESWNASPYGEIDWIPAPLPPDILIGWVKGIEAGSGRPIFAPADAVLIGRERKNGEVEVARATTAGCAAGTDADGARLAALLELIERDCAALWWYGLAPCPGIPLDSVLTPTSLLPFLSGRGRRTRLFDIASDLGIPAVAAASGDEENGLPVALGFAARLDYEEAVRAALTEMLQTEIGLAQRQRQGDPLLDLWRQRATFGSPPLLARHQAEPQGGIEADSPAHALQQCLQRCNGAGVQIVWFDLTRPQFGVPVYRALSPQLCSDKPRWGRARLWAGRETEQPANPVPIMA